MPDIDIDAPGKTVLLMGNEAIARGALEAGIGFAAAYPGTPSSEILPTIAEVARRRGIYAEWSVNEIVSIEAATGASLTGIRAMASMKQNGTQVALDFLGNLAQRGVGAGLVLVSCDDPSARNSSNEQDTRHIAKWLDVPLLEPGDFQEAKDMTKWLFDLSEEVEIFTMLRAVSKISHTRGNVRLGELPDRQYKARFPYDRSQRASQPLRLMGNPHAILHQKMAIAQEKFESSPFNRYVGPDNPKLLIITCGSCWLYSQEAVRTLGLENRVGILKLGTTWPIPEKLVTEHLSKAPEVLFVEEIDPFVERSVMELAANLPPSDSRPVFYGKRSGHINAYGELNPDPVINALTKIMDITYEARDSEYVKKVEAIPRDFAITRGGALCPGCPHRASFWAIRTALKLDGRGGFATGDIGCYTQGLGPGGFTVVRTLYCMGGSAGIATGLGKLGQFGFNQPVLAVCGDSTFFHATIPALINGVYNNSNFTLVALDNSATAMTGFQPHPGTGFTAMGDPAPTIKIEDICRSLGIRVEVCDPFDLENTTETLLDMMAMEGGVRVVVMKRECELVRGRREKPPYKVEINPDLCIGDACGCDRLCTRIFLCPGLRWNKEAGKSEIDPIICTGCGVCVDICPQGAITREAT
ncbi:MAG: 4Fe-4S binding protein [Dehalococcoidales bacterium]|nr:MAG: 4Fe-4S binding protein [Dehalococcoidales bacterium]